MNSTTKLVLSHLGVGVLGAAIGAVASYFIYRGKLDKEFRDFCDEEEEFVRIRFQELEKDIAEREKENIVSEDQVVKEPDTEDSSLPPSFSTQEKIDYHAISSHYRQENPDLKSLSSVLNAEIPPDFDPDGLDVEEDPEAFELSEAFCTDRTPESLRRSAPYLIDPGDYARNCLSHDKITVRYDVAAGRVFDEDGDEVEISETIGEAWLDGIDDHNTDAIYYVRNDVECADYEIMYDVGTGDVF